ncbi:hypothetical protein EJ110_NYTH03556 [Nymphaea thermarum]|nr:hypothetical protein EJ110_NYTH03556 [Nymphaea thermarum]
MTHLANLISLPMPLHTAVKLEQPHRLGQTTRGPDPDQARPSKQQSWTQSTYSASSGWRGQWPAPATHSSATAFRLTNLGRMLVTDDWGLSLGTYVLQHNLDALTQGVDSPA